MSDLKQVLSQLHGNLNILREREAKYSSNAPLELLNQINDHEQAIALTEEALRDELTDSAWREQMRPLLVQIRDWNESHPEWSVTIGEVERSIIGGRDITARGDIVTGVKQTVTGNYNAQASGDGARASVTIHHHHYPLSTKSKSGRCDHYAHINLPPNFVPRPELLASIKQTLLTGSQHVALTSTIQMSALHGMGGIGKSVLARALCNEPEVQERFSDGILWTTLGQAVTEDDLKAKLWVWIEALGGVVNLTAPTLNQLKNILAEQLKERVCLLIVDDMWCYPDAAWFNVSGSSCSLLLTTRDAEAARQLGATIAPVAEMTEAEAITLLEEWAGQPLSQNSPPLIAQIVQRLGYLPLALKLAGEQLRRKSLHQWLNSFSAQKLKSHRDETVHGNLFDTFALSLMELTTEEQQLYTSLVIFKEDEPIPLPAIEMLWSQLAGYELEASEDLLADLVDRALLQQHLDQAVTLHDLVRDFMAAHLPEDGQRKAHFALLAGYRATQIGQGWASTPDDGYLYDHLAYYLSALVAYDETVAAELCQLFANDNWLQTRVVADDYRYDGYLADLDIAWQRMEQQANQTPKVIGELIHYALIQTSINSLAGQYDPALVARAVEIELWSVERAISVASKIVEPHARAEVCHQVLVVGQLHPSQISQLAHLGLQAAEAIDNEEHRAMALAALAPHLEGEVKERTLMAGLQAAEAIDNEEHRAMALAALAPHLEGEVKERTLMAGLQAAEAIDNEQYRAEALAALAPHLEGTAKERALVTGLQTAETIVNDWYRAKALVALLPQMDGRTKKHTLAAGLKAAEAIFAKRPRAEMLAALAPHLEGEVKERTLMAGLQAADTIEYERDRAMALAALAPHLDGEVKERVLMAGLQAAEVIDNEGHRAEVLMALVPQLEGAQLKAELQAATAIDDEQYRAKALVALAPHLERTAKERALGVRLQAVEEAIGDERSRARALAALAPHLEREQLLKAGLQAVEAIGNEQYRAKALAALAPHLEREQLLKAGLQAATAIGDEEYRAEALAALAPHLEGEQLLKAGLQAAEAIGNEQYRAEALGALAPQLTSAITINIIVANLERLRIANRDRLLYFLSQEALFNPEKLGVSSEVITDISHNIINVCTKWRWL